MTPYAIAGGRSRSGDVSQVAPIDKSSIVLTLVFAALFLGEKLSLKTLVAGGLITAGTFGMLWK